MLDFARGACVVHVHAHDVHVRVRRGPGILYAGGLACAVGGEKSCLLFCESFVRYFKVLRTNALATALRTVFFTASKVQVELRD